MKQFKKVMIFVAFTFIISIGMISIVNAADISGSGEATVSVTGASATVKCTGIYHSSGNSRWSNNWFATLKTGKNAYCGTATMTVASDSKMTTSNKVYLTNDQLVTKSVSKTAECTYASSKVTVKYTQ